MVNPTRSDWIQNGDVKLHVETWGRRDAPRAILFVHGWISSHRIWHELIRASPDEGWVFFLLDLRGAGRSDRPLHGHDLDGYASDVMAALKWIGRACTLVGHSAGGKISQYVAVQAAGRGLAIERLCLVSPGPASPYLVEQRFRDQTEELYGDFKKIQIATTVSLARPISLELKNLLAEDAYHAQREFWFGWSDHGRGADFSSKLNEITVPTIAITGERDFIASPERVQREVVARIKGCRFKALSGVGHLPPLEAPAELQALISAFVAEPEVI